MLKESLKQRNDGQTMTIQEFNEMIDAAESDEENGRLSKASDIYRDIEEWNKPLFGQSQQKIN